MTTTVTGPRGTATATPPLDATSLVVVLDHAHARFFLVRKQETTELPCLASPRMRGGKFHSDRQGSPGWGERAFHRRRREEEHRHYAAVARRIAADMAACDVQALVVCGTGPVVAGLRSVWPPALERALLGTVGINPLEASGAVAAHVARNAQRDHAARQQAQWVEALNEAFGRGQAAVGLRDVLHALAFDQVRTLLVGRGFARPGYRCAASGRLVLTKAEAQHESVVRVPDVVSAARDEAQRRGGDVIEIVAPPLAARIDGVAALLRFR